MKKTFLFVLAFPLTAACGSGEEPQNVREDIPESAYSTFYSRTMVTLKPDGNHEVRVDEVSLAQEILEREAEENGDVNWPNPQAEGLSRDPDCLTTSLRIWSANNYTGDILCINGTGHARLDTWCRVNCLFCGCTDYWGPTDIDDVNSYKTGDKSNMFGASSLFICGAGTQCTIEHNANAAVNDAGTCETNTDTWVARQETCTPT